MSEPEFLPAISLPPGVLSPKEKAVLEGSKFVVGAIVGGATHQAIKPSFPGQRSPGLTAQVGSAMGAAASNGAGVGGTVAAGAAVVIAKGAAVAAVATAAAPFVAGAAVLGLVGYGLSRLFRD